MYGMYEVGGSGMSFLLLLLKYYPEEKNVECLLLKQWKLDLESDLKEELDLKSRCCFTLLEPVMAGSWISLNPNVGKYASVCVTL